MLTILFMRLFKYCESIFTTNLANYCEKERYLELCDICSNLTFNFLSSLYNKLLNKNMKGHIVCFSDLESFHRNEINFGIALPKIFHDYIGLKQIACSALSWKIVCIDTKTNTICL